MVRVKPYWHDRNRPAEKRRHQVEIKFRWPEDKSLFRERSVAPVRTKDAALRWGRDREAALLAGGKAALEPVAPATVVALYKDFWKDTFIPIYCKAERLKPSGIESKWWAYNHYLRPIVGEKRLDEIGTEDIQRIKASLEKKSPKTVNNVLTVLSTSLKFASREGVRGQDGLGLIERAPRIRLQKTARPKMGFYENDDFLALAQAAGKIDTRTLVLVLLGGDAGLRRGEMIGRRWCDVDFRRRQITVRQSAWKDTMGVPKGWPRADRRDDRRPARRPEAPPAPAERAGPVLRRWLTCHPEDAPVLDLGGAAASEPAARRCDPHPAPHLLFAPRDGGSTGTCHPGSRGTRGPVDDDAVHAPGARRAGDAIRLLDGYGAAPVASAAPPLVG